MSTVKPVEYSDASPAVRAVFDDIKTSRNVPDVNNFWKYLARDPVTLKRTSALPDVPTIAESGYPGFDAATWHAIVAPPGLPKDVVAVLHKAVHQTLDDPATKKALTDLGVDLVNSSPEVNRGSFGTRSRCRR